MAKAPRRLSIADVLGFGSAPQRNLTQGYRQAVNRPATGTIKPDRKTFSRKIGEALTPNTRAGNEYANKIASLLDLITMTGSEEPLVQARGAASRGDYGQAAGLGILAALGAFPGVGKVGGKAAREAAEAAAERGIIAYHGSPHSFDRFDMSKIGTGEGAQSYGHGLYFAEAEDVAKSYRDALSADTGFSFNGKSNLSRDDVISEVEKLYGKKFLDNVTRPSGVADLVIDAKILGGGGSRLKEGSERKAVFDKLMSEISHSNPGSMYQVRINANPDDFADWDKPFFEQPQNIQKAIEYAFGPQPTFGRFGSYSMDKPREMHTRLMSEKGVKGIKYLDQGSRTSGEGSRNYVVFDDALIDILKKYGIAIPAIAGGGLLATQPQQDGGI